MSVYPCCPRDRICLSLLSQKLFLCLSIPADLETVPVSVCPCCPRDPVCVCPAVPESLSVCLSLLSQRLCIYSSQSQI